MLRLLAPSVLVVLAAVAAATDSPPDEARADAALKALRKWPTASLRAGLVAFPVAHPGTKAALEAAGMLRDLPSPLDRLRPNDIDAHERFKWQPPELVGVVGEHTGRHASPVAAVVFSPDGGRIASGGGAFVRLWNAKTMRLDSLSGHSGNVSSVAFSRDGKTLVAGSTAGTVAVWDLPANQPPRLRFHITAATSPVYAVACHPDNKRIGAACFDHLVRIYDISGATHKEAAQVTGHKGAVHTLAFSPDGKQLATGSADGTARLWDTASFNERCRIEGIGPTVTAVAFTPAGKTLATGGSDGTVRLWAIPAAPRPRVPRTTFRPTRTAVSSLHFSASGNTLAVCGGDSSVRLWALSGKVQERFKLDGHAATVRAAAYSPDMKLLVSGGDDWTVRTWDLTAKPRPAERLVPRSHLSHVYSLAFAPDGSGLVSGSLDRVTRVWDLSATRPKTRHYLKGDGTQIYAVAWSPDGKWIAAGGGHTRVRQYDATRGDSRPGLAGLVAPVYAVAYSPDGKRLLATGQKSAVVFDALKGAEVVRFTNHETTLWCGGFSPDGRLAFSGSGTVLHDKAGRPVMRGNQRVFTDCHLRLWDARTGAEVAAIHDGDTQTPFYAAQFTPAGKHLLAGVYRPSVRRWSWQGGKATELPEWKAASGNASLLLATPDGRRVVTRGLDARLIIWDTATGKRVREWAFPETVGGVAVSSDSRHLAVGLGTGVIYVLRLEGSAAK